MPDGSNNVSFYVVAHADDIQLFMNPNASADILSGDTTVVFIITTAGDAGTGPGYWSAREYGTISSVRVCLQSIASTINEVPASTPGAPLMNSQTFNDHAITAWSATPSPSGPTYYCYFMRLPDGNYLDGTGYPDHQHESLAKLYYYYNPPSSSPPFPVPTNISQFPTSSITAVDQSETYQDWNDFVGTVQAIVASFSPPNGSYIQYQNPDSVENPLDHCDHYATGMAVQSMTNITSFTQRLFQDYAIASGLPVNNPIANGVDAFWKTSMVAAYEKAVFDLGRGQGQVGQYTTVGANPEQYIAWTVSAPSFTTIDPSLMAPPARKSVTLPSDISATGIPADKYPSEPKLRT